MSAMMTRRTFAASIACATLGNAFASNASIIKSASAAKTTSFLHQDEDFSLIPYVQDGLMSFWDAIWNASIGKTDEKQRMVDLCRHNGDIYVSSGVATFGSMVEFDGELSFVCDDMKHANALIANGVYDENAKFMVSMLTDLANVPSDAYREGITIADCNPSSSLYAAFEVSSQMFRSLSLLRNTGRLCASNSNAQIDVRKFTSAVSQTTLYQTGMTYQLEMLNNDTLLLSDVKTSSFAGRLPNEPGIVKRTILDAYISNFTGCVGARFGRLLIYNRHLTVEEQQYNFEVDKQRFGL